jgi:hypothetical protein
MAIAKVDTWADDIICNDDYDFMPLHEINFFVRAHKHLPGVPIESEVKERGIAAKDTLIIFLRKVEELTLHNSIAQEKRLKRSA